MPPDMSVPVAGRGMAPDRFDAVSRHLAWRGSRRTALGAVAVAMAAAGSATPEVVSAKGCNSKHSEKQILKFIGKAAKKYGQSKTAMVRVARCESNLDPCAVNKKGPYYGLYQFLKSTWSSTPYRDKNIYDPKAQALAAAWMWKQGRKNEWACQ